MFINRSSKPPQAVDTRGKIKGAPGSISGWRGVQQPPCRPVIPTCRCGMSSARRDPAVSVASLRGLHLARSSLDHFPLQRAVTRHRSGCSTPNEASRDSSPHKVRGALCQPRLVPGGRSTAGIRPGTATPVSYSPAGIVRKGHF